MLVWKSQGGRKVLEYKGYTGRVEFDDEAMLFHGEVIGLRDVVTFQGTSVEELEEAFRDSVDDYLEFCAERGEEPDKQFSGRFVLRLPPQLHRDIYLRAQREGKSLNLWILEALEGATRDEAPRHSERELHGTSASGYHVSGHWATITDIAVSGMKLGHIDSDIMDSIDLSDFESLSTFVEDEDPPDAQEITPILIGFVRTTKLPGQRPED